MNKIFLKKQFEITWLSFFLGVLCRCFSRSRVSLSIFFVCYFSVRRMYSSLWDTIFLKRVLWYNNQLMFCYFSFFRSLSSFHFYWSSILHSNVDCRIFFFHISNASQFYLPKNAVGGQNCIFFSLKFARNNKIRTRLP